MSTAQIDVILPAELWPGVDFVLACFFALDAATNLTYDNPTKLPYRGKPYAVTLP